MLQSFSDRIRNSKWLGYAIVIAISIPFALWGVQAYFGGADPDVAAEVNGEPIQEAQVQQMVSQRRQQLRQRFGGELPSVFSNAMLREQVLGQLITRELLRQVAADAGLQASEDMIAERIREQQFFQRDGQFDRELYQRTLSQAGLSPQQYEAQVREGHRLEQLRSGVAATAFVLPAEARRDARLRGEERRIAVLRRDRATAAASVEIPAADLEAYYEENREAFESPHRVRVAYIEADLAALREQVEVGEEAIRAEYESNRQQYRQAAERRASHILIEVPDDAGEAAEQEARERARRLRERIAEGADFAALAREHSDDPGSANQGGDLGFISRGTMVEPFEEALFSLDEAGDVAGPVRTSYGFHIVRLEDLREPEPQPLSAVRDEIRKELATRRAERLFYDRVEVLESSAYENPGSLEPAAEATGFEIRRSDWFSREQGDGIAGTPEVRNAAFGEAVLAERRNSDLIELGERRVAVLRVVDERPPEPRPLDAVREQVRQRLEARRVEQALDEWAQDAIARLRGGATPDELTASEGVTVERPGWLARDAQDADLGRRALRAAFEASPPAAGESRYQAVSVGGGRAVVIVEAARLPEVDAETVSAARDRLRQTVSQGELQAWIAGLRNTADVIRNDPPTEGGGGSAGGSG